MWSRMALAGSIAIHLVIGALLILINRAQPPASDEPVAQLELIDVPSVIQLVDLDGSGGGGSRGSTHATSSQAAATQPVQVAMRERRSTTMPISERRTMRAELGEIAIERRDLGDASGAGSGDGGEGLGQGVGVGRGIGRGIGPGFGTAIAPHQIVPPPAPRASKARPPKLIYPTRERDVDEGELFVARVTIDTDGYVVGSRLIRGAGGRRDSQAAGQIFRFRYAPALDDEGKPIRATLDQPFLVQ